MKNYLILFTSLMMVLSCSKNLENRAISDNDDTSIIDSAADLPNLVSVDTFTTWQNLIKKPLTTHEKDSIAKVTRINPDFTKNAVSITTEGSYSEYSDYSGYIHLKVFWAQTNTKVQIPALLRSVPDEYAMVGGGALVLGYTGNGAFLTESRPLNNNTWIGRSKAHIIPDAHYLKVFAIGMRIDGVDPAYLRSKIFIEQATSGYSDFPEAVKIVHDNCLLVGGGAWDNYNGYGNLLIGSRPDDVSWIAAGKAYRRSDLSQITVYTIGLADISYPSVGYLQVTVRQTQCPAYTGEQWCYAPVWDGYALTCPGGYCTYNFLGRHLVGLYPNGLFPDAQVISRDTPGFGDFGGNSAFAVGIQKRPY